MHLVFDVQRAHDNNQLVFSQCVGKLPLNELDDCIQWLVCTEDSGLANSVTCIVNSIACFIESCGKYVRLSKLDWGLDRVRVW